MISRLNKHTKWHQDIQANTVRKVWKMRVCYYNAFFFVLMGIIYLFIRAPIVSGDKIFVLNIGKNLKYWSDLNLNN